MDSSEDSNVITASSDRHAGSLPEEHIALNEIPQRAPEDARRAFCVLSDPASQKNSRNAL
jgi:hypothetical protein